MSRHLAVILILIAALSTAACAPQPQQVGELPTVFVLPSLTPSHTPTETHTPTATSTASATPTPTLTPTATSTATPTATNTPTATFTPSLTATLNATVAAPTATQSSNVTPSTPTVEGLAINAFTASAPTASVGGTITLTWQAIGDQARIETVNPQGIVISQADVALTGTLPVVVPSVQGTSVIYRLVVLKGGQERSQIVTVGLTLVCPIPWFFGTAIPALGCPVAPAETGAGAFQAFEQGVMFYVNANNRNTIYALANQGAVGGIVQQNTYQTVLNGWNGSTDHCTETPPAGFVKPEQQFNWMACANFGPAGTWRNTVGWGLSPIQVTTVSIQFGLNGVFVLSAPTGVIYSFTPIPSGQQFGTWQRIN